ncbi:MAG TPA: fibronectin type III domain-containing protein [Candidatus Saccharimonadales bacterium]|nr:fibronectin type III domain-containing protein [Candidatus Saccharimonadales bacterium]
MVARQRLLRVGTEQIQRGLFVLISLLFVFGAALQAAPGAAALSEPNDEIHSSFGDNATEEWVYWHGPDNTLNYGLTANIYTQSATAVNPSVQPVDGTTGPFWQVKLTGLTPGTTYHYQIGTSGFDHTFQTEPTGDFTWDDVGDTGSTWYESDAPASCNKTWMPEVWQQLANDQPNFVTHGGDIDYENECGQPSVHRLWNDIETVSEQTSMQFVWGNHEYGSPSADAPPGTPKDSMANYKGRFNIPNAQTISNDTATNVKAPGCPSATDPTVNGCRGDDWGYFTAGHVLFIQMPEAWYNAYTDWEPAADQLMAQAEADPNIYFIVTMGHRPAYSSSTNQVSAAVTTVVNELGDKYSPSARPDGKYVLNVAHHVHGGEVFSPQHGVVNVTNGGGGSEEMSLSSIAGTQWFTGHPEHMRTTVTGNSMTLNFICGPVFTLNPNKEPCTKDSVLYSLTLHGYQADQTPATPVLATALDDGVSSASVGDALHYQLTVSDTQSGTTAAGVTPSLTLPSNVTITDAAGGTVNGQTVTWPSADIVSGQPWTQTVTAQLASGAGGSSFSANATVQAADCQNSGSVCQVSDTDTVTTTPTTVEYITNPSVESSLTGWTGLYNSLSKANRITTDAYDGSASIQLLRNTTTAGAAGIRAKPDPVASAVAGDTYTASAWLRSEVANQKLIIMIQEKDANGNVVSSGSTAQTLSDTNWHQLSVSYTAQTSGDSLAFVVYNPNMPANDWFHMDLMSMTGPGS